jgi:cytochrome c556
MMNRKMISIGLASTLLASCQTTRDQTDPAVVETHEAMVHWINPATLAIWDVSDGARSETEGLDPARMNEAKWALMESAARSLEYSSRRMAKARTLRVGDHTAVEAGFATKPEIQQRIDADPIWFRKISLRMADDAHQLGAAATARNLRRTRDLAQTLNESCQTCHTRYWEKPAH